jgi:hypothetical protein
MREMFGNLITLVALRRTGLFLTGLAFAMAVPVGGNAADLRLPINFTPLPKAEFDRFLADRQVPASAEGRKRLFQEFLSWRRARQHH